MNKKVLGIIALALVCVFAGTIIGSAQPAATAEEKVVLTSPFTEAIAKVRDSVVGVNNYQIVTSYGSNYDNFGGYFPWSYFGFGNGNGNGYNYNQPDSSQEVKYGSGSGVVVAKEYVLTNYHVVENAHSLKISIGEDKEEDTLYDATVAASDPDRDVAVLYVPGLPLEPVELGDSDALEIGDWVVNIGNAIGFTGTATAGIVSGVNREIESDTSSIDKYGRSSKITNRMIQTDAAINSGNSGGGMFNTAGQLVGIPTLKYTGTRYNLNVTVESIGMCIPINEAKEVIEKAISGKGTEAQEEKKDEQTAETASGDLSGKPRMGVTVSTVRDTNGKLPKGAYIVSVQEGSPADKAGLKKGDIMVEINGQVVTSVTEEIEIVSRLKEGDEVSVKVFRPDTVTEDGRVSYAGQYVDVTVTLAIVDEIAQ
jgi:serine protease Do